MIAIIRTGMQMLLGWALGYGPIAFIVGLLVDAGISHDQIVNWATVVGMGLVMAIPKALERTRRGAKLVEWWNLIISWGLSRSGPEYQPKHLDPPASA